MSLARPPDNNNEVQFIVGNTYRQIPSSNAKLDRTGKHRKIHDWTLYVDVLNICNPDLIQSVTFHLGSTFQPSSFTCSCPVLISNTRNNNKVWRFSTRQQTYGTIRANINILGVGKSRMETSHTIQVNPPSDQKIHTFVEDKPFRPLSSIKMKPEQKFGIELELTSPANAALDGIGNRLSDRLSGRFGRISVIHNYREGRNTTENWKIVPDSSIVCNLSAPNCTTFELVSPVLMGGKGLDQVSQVLTAVGNLTPKIQVNKSMGFHVHIDVSALSVSQLVKVCQNFIKYEDAIDAIVPPSRRTGSTECDRYFSSNRDSIDHTMGTSTNRERHSALAACDDIEGLARCMNGNGRYHKLNLQNLVTGRQTTLEFRQHSATVNSRKVSSWVRFCVRFVENSARFASPSSLKESRTLDFQFEALFQFVIKDRALRNYYRGRRVELAGEHHVACCTACADGSVCDRSDSGGTVY